MINVLTDLKKLLFTQYFMLKISFFRYYLNNEKNIFRMVLTPLRLIGSLFHSEMDVGGNAKTYSRRLKTKNVLQI